VAVDLHRFYQLDDVEELLDVRTWHWLLGRCYSLLNIPDSFTRKEAVIRGI